jgi:hypothetical protein
MNQLFFFTVRQEKGGKKSQFNTNEREKENHFSV